MWAPFDSYNTFASAGSDGTVSIWDHQSKKRLRQYPRYRAAVPSVSFNCDGSKLAVGVSYCWDEGAEGARTAEVPHVHIRDVGEECKVRRLFQIVNFLNWQLMVVCSPNPGRAKSFMRFDVIVSFCYISVLVQVFDYRLFFSYRISFKRTSGVSN